MKPRRSFQVKEVAAIASVSVRALHHYDEIGLLVPKGRTQAGYRLYDENDLLRLQQIVIGQAWGLPDDPVHVPRLHFPAAKGIGQAWPTLRELLSRRQSRGAHRHATDGARVAPSAQVRSGTE